MRTPIACLLCGSLLLFAGCATLKRAAIDRVGDSFASGGDVFASDNDPELIRSAAPFSLKLLESLLAQSPDHRGLLLAAASGFTQYAYAFVQQDADELEVSDIAAAGKMRLRARKLYLRGRDYGLRGLSVAHPDFATLLARDPRRAVRNCTREDVALLYWTAAGWAGAIAVVKDRPDLIAELPQVEAMLDRAIELDEGFGRGALHTLLIGYEFARRGVPGEPLARAERHFARAVALSGGNDPGPYVAYAEQVCVQQQDRERFQQMLNTALAIDPDAQSSTRLVALVMQRRARWLLGRMDELFAPVEPHS